jgi:hypothetical protein
MDDSQCIGGAADIYQKHSKMIPSPRRFDQWPRWKTFLVTNPLFIADHAHQSDEEQRIQISGDRRNGP